MLNAEQLKLLQENPKTFLAQYKYLEKRAQSRLMRIDFFEKYENTGSHCKMLIEEAREFLTLKSDIEALILNANIKPNYKEVLRLRFLEGLTINEIAQEVGTIVRWTARMQARGLAALVNSI